MAVAGQNNLTSVPIHGVRVHDVTMSQALEVLDGFVREGGPHHVVTLDASMCVLAQADAELARIIRAADLVTPDSAGVLWACRRSGHALPERVSGIDIVTSLASRSPAAGYRIFLLGAAPGVAAEAAERLEALYPGCHIVGTHHGYFRTEEDPSIVQMVAASKPDVLLVAMGIPKQEKWIDHHRDALQVPVMVGVGGSLDVCSGRTRRAPSWMQRLNIEWLYRVALNPRKLSKVMTLPRFVALTLFRRKG